MDIERQMEILEARHFAADQRGWDKLGRQMDAAEPLVGELCREGARVFYINVLSKTGRMTGATREFGSRSDAVSFLIRNRYV